jgi:hypothetical protein
VTEDKKYCKTFTGGTKNGIDSEGVDKQSKCYRFSKIVDKDPTVMLEALYASKQSFLQKFALITPTNNNMNNDRNNVNENKKTIDV